ncbi:MAG: hypothetical protein UV46_C0056G0008, partial [Candidatus Gottesmanbacteria bacterium GW2011_GWC2_42_8]
KVLKKGTFPSLTPTNVPGLASCTDSDVSSQYPDGLDYFQKGTTVQKQPDGMVKTFEDYCAYAVVNQEGQANPPYSGLQICHKQIADMSLGLLKWSLRSAACFSNGHAHTAAYRLG